ncbi:opsin, ultraviolet-sensitive-like [Diorhabda carinulata]|uniref:opsin, ultraviolet-sensitive-like n=1 Tax=Diorhabda sublineata TaxID=1163346 RepID=UPI0024E17F3A|nr:opsin, ultraviolet-sensitive-like [Diorhabda sublineata]XP_057658314.1 opsin, ultraviolet-sensitive-like [Diorhabda carinulata]
MAIINNWTAPLQAQARLQNSIDDMMIHHIGWNVDPEDLIHIPKHWQLYPDPDKSLHFLLGMIYVFLWFAATIGNGMVLWIFTSAKSLRTASNIFVVNLAFSDFLMFVSMPIFIYNSFHGGFAAGWLSCKIYSLIGALSGISQGMTNACIAYDRYTTITRPFDGKISKTKAVFMVIFVWIYTLPWALLPMFEIWGRFIPEGYLTVCTFDYLTTTFDTKLFVGTIFFCSYVIPMTAIIFFYSQIVSKVFEHEKALKEQAKKMNVESLRSNQQHKNETAEVRIAKAAITVCFLFVASWTPYAAIALIGAFGDQSLLTPGVSMIPALTCKLVACLDPYVYAISHPRYRIELQKRLPWLAIKEDIDAQSTATETSSPPLPSA